MLFYIIQWLVISFLIASRRKKYRNLNLFIAGLIYVFFAVYRDVTVDRTLDAYVYYNIFLRADLDFSAFLAVSNVEIGYSFLVWVIKHIFDSNLVVLLIGHSVVYISYVYFWEKVSIQKYRLLVVLLICLDFFSAYYIYRNIISVALALVMMVKLSEKKYKSAIVFLAFAISVHYSALIMCCVVVFNIILDKRETLSKSKIVFYTLAAVVSTVASLGFLERFMLESDKYSTYDNTGNLPVGTLICVIIVVLFSLVKLKVMIEKYPITRTLFLSLCLVFIIIPLEMQFAIMYRMLLFFLPVLYIMLMYLQDIYKGSMGYYFIRIFSAFYLGYQIYIFFTTVIQFIGVPYVSIL